MAKKLILIIGLNIFELLIINFFPYPEIFVYPYLISRGLLPYKQILDQHFPGLMLLPINFYNLGMHSPDIARVWQIGVVVIIHILLYLVGRKFFKNSNLVLLANLTFAVFQPFYEGYVFWIDSIIPIFLLGCVYFLFREKVDKRSAIKAGVVISLAIIFKQIILPIIFLIFIYLVVTQKDKKVSLIFLLPSAIVLIFLVSYMFYIKVLPDFYFWTIKFNLTTFAQMGRKFPTTSELVRFAVIFGTAFVSLIGLLLKKFDKKIYLVSILFMSGLLFAYARFDFVHLQPALPFACLLIVLFTSLVWKDLKFEIVALGWLAISALFLFRFYKSNIGGRVYFFTNLEMQITSQVQKYSKPGDTIFAYVATPHIYYLTNTVPPGDIFVFQFPWFMHEAEGEVLAGLVSDPPKVVIRQRNQKIDGLNFDDQMINVSNYLNKNYKVIDKVEDIDIMTPSK